MKPGKFLPCAGCSGGRLHRLADSQRADIRIVLQLVEAAQEFPAVPRIVFPRVFAIQNQAHRRGSPIRLPIADRANPPMQIFRRRFRSHAAVDEPDQVRKIVVAKEPSISVSALKPPRRVQFRAILRIARGVAPESDVARAPQHPFVGGKPLKPQFHRDFSA